MLEVPLLEIDLVDPVGRWSSHVSSTGEVVVHPLAGYTRVEFLHEEPGVSNCFVYDQALAAGEAVIQLLRAIQPGIEFTRFSPLAVSAVNHEPLLAFNLDFVTTMPPIERGHIQVYVHPRLDFPVVCSVETPQAFVGKKRDVVIDFIEQFDAPLDAPSDPELHRAELWKLIEGDTLIGFRHLRVTGSGGNYSTAIRSSRLWLSNERTSNLDRLQTENENRDGLLNMTWLEMAEGQVLFRGQVENEGAFGAYRYGVERQGNTSTGRFPMPHALRGNVWLHARIDSATSGRLDGLYLPDLHVEGESNCELTLNSLSTGPAMCLSCSSPSAQGSSMGIAAEPRALSTTVGLERIGIVQTTLGSLGCDELATPKERSLEQAVLMASVGQWPQLDGASASASDVGR